MRFSYIFSEGIVICLLTTNTELAENIKADLFKLGIRATLRHPGAEDGLTVLYDSMYHAAVVDASVEGMPPHAWIDMLTSLGRRMPVVVLANKPANELLQTSGRFQETINWLIDPTVTEVVNVLDACGAIGLDRKRIHRESIPNFSPQVPLHMLQKRGALSVLVINASSFRKIAVEYGGDVYHRVQDSFQQVLYEMWGAPGSFRSADILCRKSPHSNTYYIFLEQSRSTSTVPAPGVLERLADRVAAKLQNALWNDIFLDKSRRSLPECIKVVPEIAVGHATAIFNPCIDSSELVDSLLDTAAEVARVQCRRMRDRQRELMQTLIRTPNLLLPHFQAVFDLQKLTREHVEKARQTQSLTPLKSLLYGFESLIRVRTDAADAALGSDGLVYLESKFLRPDVLFSLATDAKVALELDQVCLHHAASVAHNLPGRLMVNILPRNLYHIDRLRHLMSRRVNIMFEVSESEAISNLDLMLKVRSSLEEMGMEIATDDFGKGYAGLERIIQIRPDMIKIDRTLIQNIHQDHPKEAFVAGLVEAAKICKTTILAEGVETWEEAELLQKMGIHLIQGFLLHRPQPIEKIEQDLQLDQDIEVRLDIVA